LARQPLEDAEFTMHLSDFTRREEIWTYATAQGISFNEAVVRLVNHALSHRAHQSVRRGMPPNMLPLTETLAEREARGS
jgi:hypothetical protein